MMTFTTLYQNYIRLSLKTSEAIEISFLIVIYAYLQKETAKVNTNYRLGWMHAYRKIISEYEC